MTYTEALAQLDLLIKSGDKVHVWALTPTGPFHLFDEGKPMPADYAREAVVAVERLGLPGFQGYRLKRHEV